MTVADRAEGRADTRAVSARPVPATAELPVPLDPPVCSDPATSASPEVVLDLTPDRSAAPDVASDLGQDTAVVLDLTSAAAQDVASDLGPDAVPSGTPVAAPVPGRTAGPPASPDGLLREWRPDFLLDLSGVLGPLRRGAGDPTWHADGAAVWRASTTAAGPATLRLHRRADGTVVARAWGPGADVVLDALPALLGADDDPDRFVAHHPLVADALRRRPGLRLGASGRVWDVLVPAILEQKVTGTEARRSWRELCRRFGDPAPGPAPDGMRVPLTPAQLRAVPDWEWHRAGVDHSRGKALRAAAAVAHRLERACELGGSAGRELLRRVPGIGVWTAAEVAQRAWGDPDAVSFGDFHIPSVVGWALLGRPLDDAGMLEVLAPYVPQRQRAVRYIEASGFRRPRFGPRFSPRDYRAM